jgi:predicted PurR-regulated permease PerM
MDQQTPERPNDDVPVHEDGSHRIKRAQAEVDKAKRSGGKALGTLAVLAVLYTLYFAAAILLPFVFAIVLYLLLSPALRFMNRRLHIPKILAALLLILLLFVVVGGITAAISVPASDWVARAPSALPKLAEKLTFLNQPIQMAEHGYDQISKLMGGSGQQNAGGGSFPGASSLTSFGSSLLLGLKTLLSDGFTILLLLFFFLSSGDTLLRRLIEVLPSWDDKKRAIGIATEIEENVAAYLATITVMNVLVGTLNGLQVWLLGMPNPLLFGTVAFLLNYIPIIGPLTGVVTFGFIGLFTFSNPLLALATAGIYLAIHVMEGETITPMLLARRLTLNPVLVIVSLFFWDWLWGIPGALLSVPLLAVTKIVCDHLPGLAAVGHMIGADKPHGDLA